MNNNVVRINKHQIRAGRCIFAINQLVIFCIDEDENSENRYLIKYRQGAGGCDYKFATEEERDVDYEKIVNYLSTFDDDLDFDVEINTSDVIIK